MKKAILRTNVTIVIVLAVLLVASLVGATTLTLTTAHAQDEQPTSVVKLTSYTTVMNVEEEFEFAAQVTLADGTVSNEVTWSTSDDTVILMLDNLALALGEGNATITATAADGASASVNVLVSDTVIRVESVTVSPEG